MLYKYKEKGPAFGLGHTAGELVEYDPTKKITAHCLVPEMTREGKPTNRMVVAKKEYTVDQLIEWGVIVPANAEDEKTYKSKQDINSRADREAAKFATLEREQFEARKALVK